jgi:predicted enzyme related to lactoylglutathione lyase
MFPKQADQKDLRAVNYFTVEDIDKYLAKVVELGGRVLMPKQQVPTVGFIALVADVEGNNLGLLQPSM